MDDRPDFAFLAAVMGDPARARMLAALLGGHALTATELALEAQVAPSTASAHLRRLQESRLVTLLTQGRHRYFRLADAEVADVLEGLADVAARSGRRVRTGPADPALRRARVCYDHLAGEAGVRLLAGLRTRRIVVGRDVLGLSDHGVAALARDGIDLAALPPTRRPLCRPCLDWSERRTHLGGAVGAAILDHIFRERWARQERGSRAVLFSPRGQQAFERLVHGL